MALDMLGLKKDMEAAMNGAEKAGEKHSLMNLKKMYGKYVAKAEMEEEEEMEKMKPGKGERAKKMMMAKKSLASVVRDAFQK